jgi:predicted transcriptional regulator
MSKKRTRLEVIRDILSVLSNGRDVKITHLIYKANLSNNSIKPYMKELLENQLIEEIQKKDKRIYTITQKGREFLQEFEKIKVFSEAYGL